MTTQSDSSTGSTGSNIGPRIQLLAKGPQDAYVAGRDFSPFTARFKRHSRFALETLDRPFMVPCVLGRIARAEIPLSADALAGISLSLRLPQLQGAHPLDTWAPSIGFVLLRRVKVLLNDVVVADHERLWMDIHAKLTAPPHKKMALDELVGAVPLTVSRAHDLLVPLHLPFSLTHVFPLIAMPGNTMTLEVHMESFDNCVRASTEARAPDAVFASATFLSPTIVSVVMANAAPETRIVQLRAHTDNAVLQTAAVPANATTVTFVLAEAWQAVTVVCASVARRVAVAKLVFPGQVPELPAAALFDTVFLDWEERAVFVRSHHVWMYETVFDQEAKTYRENVSTGGAIDRVPLKTVKVDLTELNYPVRMLAWVVYAENVTTYFDYTPDALSSCRVVVAGRELVLPRPASYFQLVTRHASGPGITSARANTGVHDGIHVYSFALRPGQASPTGALAADTAKLPFLEVTLANPAAAPAVVKVFAVVRRFLTLYKGQARFVTS